MEEIEKAVTALTDDDLTKFRTWFEEFSADAWDRQMEADIKAGRLDKLFDEALEDYHKGNVREL